MSEIIKCPFCNYEIEKDIEICPNCNSLFSEPNLNKLKFRSFSFYFCMQILTLGFFSIIWFFVNRKSINEYSHNPKDIIKYNLLLFLLIVSLLTFLFGNSILAQLFSIIIFILNMILTYRTLRIIQKYTKNQYNTTIDFNPYYIFFFQVLYLIQFIDTYSDRVIHNYKSYDFSTPKGILSLILMIIICPSINIISSPLVRGIIHLFK